MKNIAKMGCISAGAIVGGILAKMTYDMCVKAEKGKVSSIDEFEKYYKGKKMIFEISKGNEFYKVPANNEQEIERICEELEDYDCRKEMWDKDLEYGNNCYWKNANKNEFKLRGE